MSTPMNDFLTEGNVEIYLSRLHNAWDVGARDVLLRLLVEEDGRMGQSRVHFENGERQREIVQSLEPDHEDASREALVLETLEKTQSLLEGHLELLRERFERNKL